MSAMRAPARYASATPSPVATAGFVVSVNTWPAPPVASSVARPNARPGSPRASMKRTPRQRPSSMMALTASVFLSTRMRATAEMRSHSTRPISRPGRIRRVQHAAHAVRAFGRERQFAVRVAVEPRAPLDQLARVTRPLLAEHADGALVAQAVARDHRVVRVQLGRVVCADRRGDAALRVLGVAFAGIGFRDDDDVAGRRQLNRRAEPRDSAADDYEVAAYIHRGYTTAHIASR